MTGIRLPKYPKSEPEDLTPAQARVVQMMANGRIRKEIAFDLKLKLRTVNFHIERAYARLHARTEAHLAMIALRRGLIH